MSNNKQIQIATYNILFAINTEKIIENIERLAKDGVTMFCLQEVINKENEEFILDKIIKRLGKEWKTSYHVGREISKLSIGTAIVWNTTIYQLKEEEKILLPKIKNFDLMERFYYKVVGVPSITLQRKEISCVFSFNQTDLRVTCVHVDNVGGPSHRLEQVSYLLSKLRALKTPQYEIMCGDFNTFDLLKTGYEKKVLQRKLGEEFTDASKNIDWSSDIHNIDFRTSFKIFSWFIKTFNVHIRRRLDYIWVKNFSVIECKKINLPGSDHFPIIAKLAVNL